MDDPLRLWCKTSEMGEPEQMPIFVPVEQLFAIRWHLSFKLSYRAWMSMMSERGWPENSISLKQREIIPDVVDAEMTRCQGAWTRSAFG